MNPSLLTPAPEGKTSAPSLRILLAFLICAMVGSLTFLFIRALEPAASPVPVEEAR